MTTHKAWHYANGMWTESADPIMDAWKAVDWDGSEGDALHRLGYKIQLFKVSERPLDGAFEVWCREDAPRHVVLLGAEDTATFLYVDALPDVFSLVAQLTPIARDLKLIELADGLWQSEHGVELEHGSLNHGLIETIGRRARYGWSR